MHHLRCGAVEYHRVRPRSRKPLAAAERLPEVPLHPYYARRQLRVRMRSVGKQILTRVGELDILEVAVHRVVELHRQRVVPLNSTLCVPEAANPWLLLDVWRKLPCTRITPAVSCVFGVEVLANSTCPWASRTSL